jgi:DNA methylase.
MTGTQTLNFGAVAASGPVECLGQSFADDNARREHFRKLLAEKLEDPAFRKQEGFRKELTRPSWPMSDPPYYTACPNPWLAEFTAQFGTPYKSSDIYSREPFAADVKEGKNAPVYNAHSYHTKVPHKAVMRYLLHYTRPGDVVLDAFCGTGMTGVAAQFCGNRNEVESLGYLVDDQGNILELQDGSGNSKWVKISELGTRFCVLNDLSPAASFIANGFNTRVDVHDFEQRAHKILDAAKERFSWMYQTLHKPSSRDADHAAEKVKSDSNPDLSQFGQIGSVNFVFGQMYLLFRVPK